MRRAVLLIFFSTLVTINYANVSNNKKARASDLYIIDISQQLLLAAKTKEPTDSLVNIILNLSQKHILKLNLIMITLRKLSG